MQRSRKIWLSIKREKTDNKSKHEDDPAIELTNKNINCYMFKKIEEKVGVNVWDGKMKNFYREIESTKRSR